MTFLNRTVLYSGVVLALGLGLGQAQETEQAPSDEFRPLMGWTLQPPAPVDGAPLQELDRLSQSPSGVSFGQFNYDAQSDNPLVPVSVQLRALDKITASYKDIEVGIGEQVQFGPLLLVPRTCDKRPPEETPETSVFLEVYSGAGDVQGQRTREARAADVIPAGTSRLRAQTPGTEEEVVKPEGTAIFTGWMFASTPSLNALEHPVYDVWVIDCKMVDPEI